LGAVGPVARATGAPVYCPELEQQVLANVMDYVPYPGFGPFESYDADVLVAGGEHLQLAGLKIDVVFTPGHSPGHVTYAARQTGDAEDVAPMLFSGDVLFQQSVGRTDLPGGDHQVLLQSIATLMERFPDDSVVHPGHMGLTTLGRERATNPFLTSLA
ncbi:MAG: fold metallo-hydrolase, partial [Solirubrobacterales bacterium]|nr:fold metallo-hydrolase [Solirubrobacterales bacterium]